MDTRCEQTDRDRNPIPGKDNGVKWSAYLPLWTVPHLSLTPPKWNRLHEKLKRKEKITQNQPTNLAVLKDLKNLLGGWGGGGEGAEKAIYISWLVSTPWLRPLRFQKFSRIGTGNRQHQLQLNRVKHNWRAQYQKNVGLFCYYFSHASWALGWALPTHTLLSASSEHVVTRARKKKKKKKKGRERTLFPVH